jgi:hypothetical protein
LTVQLLAAMTLEIVVEPTGQTYHSLLELAKHRCVSFSLIWRADEVCDTATAHRLASHLISDKRVTAWPGTQLLGGAPATMRIYALNDFSAKVLAEASGLYGWQHPNRPEDLTFYRADGTVWMASIAHEEQAWFEEAGLVDTDRAILANTLTVAWRG